MISIIVFIVLFFNRHLDLIKDSTIFYKSPYKPYIVRVWEFKLDSIGSSSSNTNANIEEQYGIGVNFAGSNLRRITYGFNLLACLHDSATRSFNGHIALSLF